MTLVEDGLLGLNRPVSWYIPEFAGEGKDAVMVHHLLTHTSGLRDEEVNEHAEKKKGSVEIPPPEKTQHPTINEWLFLGYDTPLWKPPGTEMSYCNYGYLLLGEIVRRVSGRSLDDFARERIFEPLGMKDTWYIVPDSVRHRIIRRSEDAPFAGLNNREYQETPCPLGGVLSTAMDMAIFGQMFLNRGIYGDIRILSPASVAEMTCNQIPGISAQWQNEFFPEASWGFGWDVHGDKKGLRDGTLHSPKAFWHGGEEISVPDTIQSVIMARIDKLEDDVRYVLQSAAVIGRLFRHKLLQYTMQKEQNLDQYLWQLEDRNLVYEERAIPELEYSFRHALTQETAYNTILSRRRKEFHRKVAEGYEAFYSVRIEECYEELAYHYGRSDDSQKALHYLVKAGDKSKEAFANDEAIEYYHQALELMDDVGAGFEPAPTIGHIYQSLGEIYFPLTKHEEALECCRKGLEYTTDKKRRARIYGTMGWMCEREGKLDSALEHLHAGIAELSDDTGCPEMARISIPLVWTTLWKGNTEESIEIALRGLNIVEGTTYYFEMTELYICLRWVYERDLRNIDKAFEYAQKGMEVAQESGNSYLIGHSTLWLGWVHMRAQLRHSREGGYDIALKLFREAAEIFERIGHSFGVVQAYFHLWFTYNRKGDRDRAIESLQRGITIPSHPYYSFLVFELAREYFQQGDTEKAIEMCKSVLEDSDSLTRAKTIFSVMGLSNNIVIAQSLSIMEESLAQMCKREEFISYCKKLREDKKEEIQDLQLTQWYLEPKELSGLFTQTAFVDEFDGPDLKSAWEWVNPKGNSSYRLLGEANGLEVRAASGSDLWRRNSDAPRLLQEISGDFAAEVKVKTASADLPSVGGLLVWKDEENFIRFEKGMHGKDEIGLSGNVQGEWAHFGRGILSSDTIYLRLERIGDRFSAYCSSDGTNWLTCGEVSLPAGDAIQVGIHAIGGVGHRGGATDTATQFTDFRVLRRADFDI